MKKRQSKQEEKGNEEKQTSLKIKQYRSNIKLQCLLSVEK